MSDVTIAERMHWLVRSVRVWLLALVLLALAMTVGASVSFSLFTSSSANPRSVVSSGSMHQVNSAGNEAIMAAHDMVPGDHVDGEVSIRNVGDARGDFRLHVEDVTDHPGPGGGRLSTHLHLDLYDVERDRRIYAGPLGALSVDLGQWAPHEKRSYRFVVTLPEGSNSTDDEYQRSTVTATFVWRAVQAR